jgi:hypothetical protein
MLLYLLLLFPWQVFYAGAQDDEGEEEDIETADNNNRNDDNGFTNYSRERCLEPE